MSHPGKSARAQRMAFMAAGGVAIVIVVLVLFGAILQLLWNVLMPQVFGLPAIGFWQAIGLFLLAKLFFGFGMGSGRGSRGWRRRKRTGTSAGSSASSEDATDATFTDERFRQYWDTEGRAAYRTYIGEE